VSGQAADSDPRQIGRQQWCIFKPSVRLGQASGYQAVIAGPHSLLALVDNCYTVWEALRVPSVGVHSRSHRADRMS